MRGTFKPLKIAVSAVEKTLYAYGLKPTAALSLPDFLGIGAQKAGTTWLHDNLRCHPELFLPARKELHYFDRKFADSLRSYAETFRPGRDKVKGEITPAYGILPRSRIRFIHSIMPNLRIIFIMRNPIERAWSHALMVLASRQNQRPQDVEPTRVMKHISSAASIQRGDYLTILDNWLEFFPRDRLMIEFYSELREQPRQLLKRVFSFLGVSTDVDWSSMPCDQVIRPRSGGLVERDSRSVDIPPTIRDRLVSLYADQIEAIQSRFGGPTLNWN